VGLWAAQHGGRATLLLPAAFVLSMVLGALLGGAGLALPGVEAGIVASVLVLGALVAAAVRVRAGVGVAVVALFALLHGHAHGTEMPATASGLAYGAGFVLATAALHGAGLLAALGLRRARGARGTPLVRLAGAAIGVAGLALTAL
jgi:urease accessory protein